ncbi:hypothetical protein ACFVXQ_29845, partial [Kitasatospora sp. NPDC058263]
YGLGVLTYLLVTGQAPGASQREVMARLEAGESLRPSALVDGGVAGAAVAGTAQEQRAARAVTPARVVVASLR